MAEEKSKPKYTFPELVDLMNNSNYEQYLDILRIVKEDKYFYSQLELFVLLVCINKHKTDIDPLYGLR